MKKKVLKARRHKDNQAFLNNLTEEMVAEIVEEAKPKKKASKKKGA